MTGDLQLELELESRPFPDHQNRETGTGHEGAVEYFGPDMVDSTIYHCGAASGLFNGTAPSAFENDDFKLMRMRSVTGECQSLSSWSAIGEYIMMKVLLVA